MNNRVGLLVACMLAIAGNAFAEIYSCREGGSTVFRDSPCGGGALPQAVAPIPKQSSRLAAPSNVSTITGTVVGVADGDTITVLDGGRQQYKIRLAGIDAPEKKQPFGERSRQNLSAMVFNRTVTIEWDKRDRYGRTVGKVMVNGVDVNLEQIKAGMAWWYAKYSREQSERDQYMYSAHEADAKAKRAGLWGDRAPVAPWDWRNAQSMR